MLQEVSPVKVQQSAFMVAWLCVAFCLPLFAQPTAPQWLQNANPGDYVLLKQNLPAGFSILGDIQADAEARGFGFTDAQGKTTQQQGFILSVLEQIEAKDKDKDEAGVVVVYVLVCGSPDRAIALAREHYGDYGMDPDWMIKGQDLGAPAIPPKGGSVKGPGKAIVRLRDMVALFSWNGKLDEFADQKTWQIAQLWLKKMGGSTPDLRVTASDLRLKQWSPLKDHEEAADKQFVLAYIYNVSADVAAKKVRVTFSVRLADDKEYRQLGKPIEVGDIAAGGVKEAKTVWDLKGQSVEKADLMVAVSSPGVTDADPSDNECHLSCSIWFAHNGKAAFRWIEDSYQFNNYGYEGREVEELCEGLLAAVLRQTNTDARTTEILERLLFPQTFVRLYDYFGEGMIGGAGGHCFGMSSTAGLYFLDAALKPVAVDTWNMRKADAATNINLYQRAQMATLAESLITGRRHTERDFGPVKCLDTVRQSLRTKREPAVIEIFGDQTVQKQVMVNGVAQMQPVVEEWGHAVLAYKLVEVDDGRGSAMYVYDPNLPPMAQAPKIQPSSALSVFAADDAWGLTSDMKALYVTATMSPSIIAARPITRELPIAQANSLLGALKAKLKEMADLLASANKIAAIVRCPADAVLTDPQGRRVGCIGGKTVCEVPGAEVRATGEVEIYFLPADRQYSVAVTGTGAGRVGFDIIRAEKETVSVTSFQSMPVAEGTRLAGTLGAGGVMTRITGADGSHTPTVVGSILTTGYTGTTTATPPGTPDGQVPELLDVNRLVNQAPPGQPGQQSQAPATGPAVTSPAASAARDACLAHLKAVARVMLYYAQDHDGRLPDATRWMDEIKAYLEDEACLKCPAAPQLLYGYAMNQALSKVALSAIARPHETVLLYESNLGTRNAAGKPESAAQPPRHEGGNHYAMADGICTAQPAGAGATAGGTAAVTTPVQPPPATTPAVRPTAQVVMCQQLDQQSRPINPGTVLAGPAGVAGAPGKSGQPGRTPDTVRAVCTHTGVPVGSTLVCVWRQDGQEFARTQRKVAVGETTMVSRWGPREGGLPAGTYEVSVVYGNQELARQPFQIVAGPPGPDGPAPAATTPAPPPATTATPSVPVQGANLLTPVQLPTGIRVPAGTTAKAFAAPFALGRPFLGPNGEVFVLSCDREVGAILHATTVGVARKCCESAILRGQNWRGAVYRDGRFVVAVDYNPAGGSQNMGVSEIMLDGSSRPWPLQRNCPGLGDIVPSPEGGFYVVDFERAENIFHLTTPGQAETPMVTRNWPGGIMRLAYDRSQQVLYGLNWGREGWSGPINGVFKLATGGDMQLVSQAPAGTTYDDMALSPGGAFAAGLYVLDAKNARVLRIVPGGAPVPVVTGLSKPGYIGFSPATGALMLVCEGTRMLWVSGG